MQIARVQDAKKDPIEPDGLDALFAKKSRLLVAKGKKLIDVSLAKLEADELERLVIGPSGKLRAPTLVRGKTVMVGYHEEGYATLLA